MTQPSPLLRRRLAAVALCLSSLGALAAPLDDMRRQVEAGQFDQAWATAQANPQLIGDVHFDFLYGVAAINVGRVAEGVLALERHLAAVPANDRARLEMARGYVLLGDYARARAEFEFVLRYNPPAGVRNTINTFLQAMQTRELADRRGSARVYIEVGLGRDNNVNGGTIHDALEVPSGTIITAGTPSRQVGDGFAQFTIGGQQSMRVSNRLSVFAGADLDHRGDFSETAYNLTTVGAYVGLSQLGAGALWRLTLGSSELMVGANRYRDTLQLNGEGNFTLGPELALTGFAQYAEFRHSQTDEVRNSHFSTVGVNIVRDFGSLPGQPSVGLRLSYSYEQNQHSRSDLSHDMPLVRVFGAFSASDKLRLSGGMTFYSQRYGAEDPAFQSLRRDHAVRADASANYTIDPRWSLRADMVLMSISSNQSLYDVSRKMVSLTVRYQY